jgi:adenylate cyclase
LAQAYVGGDTPHITEPPGHDVFFAEMDRHRVRAWIRLMRVLPSNPRCAVCRAPFGGWGGRVVKRLGFGPSRKNPRLCATCFDDVPGGGMEMSVGVLFADIRGFTTLSEQRPAAEVTQLLNEFYDVAVRVLCRHAIIDKMVGDQVMALYLPRLLGDDATDHMVDDARQLLAEIPAELDLGVGIDYGTAMVGNVGSGHVKDFTAIGDVVNTAARLQSVAGAGQIVVSRRVTTDIPGAVAQTFELKGKSQPEQALVLTPS